MTGKYLFGFLLCLLVANSGFAQDEEEDEEEGKPVKIKLETPDIGHKDARLQVTFGTGMGGVYWQEIHDNVPIPSTADTTDFTSSTPAQNALAIPIEIGLLYREGRWTFGWVFGWKNLFADTLERGDLDTLFFKSPSATIRTVSFQSGFRFLEKGRWGLGIQLSLGGFWVNEEYKEKLKKATIFASFELPLERQLSAKFLFFLTPGFDYHSQWGREGDSFFRRNVPYLGVKAGFRYLLY